MQNFPFLQEDLLPLDTFISYCRERDVTVDQNFLELLHEKGLVYPCISLDPGINIYRKIKKMDDEKDYYVAEDDLHKFYISLLYREKYYTSSSISYGRTNWLDFYLKNKMVEIPVKDEIYIPWNQFKFNVADFQLEKSYFDDHRVLFYSKKQIYPIKHIVTRRTYRIDFNRVPNQDLLLNLKQDIENNLEVFDKNFKENNEPEYLNFFEFLKKLETLRKENAIKTLKVLKADKPNFDLETDEDWDEYEKEFRESTNVLLKDFSKNYDGQWVNKWRENIINFAFRYHEDLNLFKLIEPHGGISKFYSKGKILFMLECIDLVRLLENLLEVMEFEFITIEKLFWSVDKIKICAVCRKSFIPDPRGGERTKTCTDKQCRDKFRNLQKQKRLKNNQKDF